MKQNIESPAELHADHRLWKSELSMWRNDIELWIKEHAEALKELEHASELVRRHDEALARHLEALEKIENSLDYHEKNLAESLKGRSDERSNLEAALAERHAEQKEHFFRQRSTHDKIKMHHHIAMAQVASLLMVLRSRCGKD